MSVAISMTAQELQALAKLIEMQRSAFEEAEMGCPREEVIFTMEDFEITEGLLRRLKRAEEILPD